MFIHKNNLPKIKGGAYEINLDEYEHILIALELSIFQKKLKKIISSKNIITNIYRIQANDSIFGYFSIRFFNFMVKAKVC